MSEKIQTKAAKKDTLVRKMAEDSDDSAPSAKRGRGRPKKDPSQKVQKSVSEGGEKKGRGRPKGSFKKEPKPKAEGGKRRGRPSKKSKNDSEEDGASDEN